MKKRQLIRFVIVIAVILLNAATVVLMINEFNKNGFIEKSSVLRSAAIFGASVISLVKMFVRTDVRRKPKLYRESYKVYAEKAFLTDKKKEKQFFCALDAFNNNDLNKALKLLNDLLPKSDGGADRFAVLSFIGFCYDDLKLYEKAIEFYEKALSVKEHSELASNIGRCYQQLGKVQEAIDSYKNAIHIDPNNATAFNNFGQLALSEGEYEIALQYVVKAAELDANLKPARTAMAICFYMLGMTDEYNGIMKSGVLNVADKQKVKNYLAYIGCDDEK